MRVAHTLNYPGHIAQQHRAHLVQNFDPGNKRLRQRALAASGSFHTNPERILTRWDAQCRHAEALVLIAKMERNQRLSLYEEWAFLQSIATCLDEYDDGTTLRAACSKVPALEDREWALLILETMDTVGNRDDWLAEKVMIMHCMVDARGRYRAALAFKLMQNFGSDPMVVPLLDEAARRGSVEAIAWKVRSDVRHMTMYGDVLRAVAFDHPEAATLVAAHTPDPGLTATYLYYAWSRGDFQALLQLREMQKVTPKTTVPWGKCTMARWSTTFAFPEMRATMRIILMMARRPACPISWLPHGVIKLICVYLVTKPWFSQRHFASVDTTWYLLQAVHRLQDQVATAHGEIYRLQKALDAPKK